jgi:hypothetical protein
MDTISGVVAVAGARTTIVAGLMTGVEIIACACAVADEIANVQSALAKTASVFSLFISPLVYNQRYRVAGAVRIFNEKFPRSSG